ncbi:MAG: PKD domain-containing protein [Candidatus Levybacteria bacterium]|nr:PKD domain-containing protein [Candidatus Levybacteria bacterium]
MNLFEGKKFILIGIVVALLAAIPLTVFFLQKNQETRSQAQKATTLSFAVPGQTTAATTIQKNTGEAVPIDVVMDPGSNQVSFVKMSISYDATKLSTDSAGIQPNTATFPSVLEGPIYTDGNITITLSIGADPTKLIQTPSKIATINFKAKDVTGSTPTQVKFIDGQTQVLSIASSDQPSENVLASTKPVSITIEAGTNPTTTPNPTTQPGPSTANVAPTCTSLTLDRTPSGAAPFAVTFTANGRDTDGTISKVTFNFGDGPVQDVTQSGGIGTNTVSVPLAHTYNNAGTFQASAILTDNQGGISSSTCTQTITVTAKPASSGGGAVGGATTAPQTPAATATPIPVDKGGLKPTMAPPGPGDTILKVGVLGTILSIVGALTFFAL